VEKDSWEVDKLDFVLLPQVTSLLPPPPPHLPSNITMTSPMRFVAIVVLLPHVRLPLVSVHQGCVLRREDVEGAT
jgi:hypothetical protein